MTLFSSLYKIIKIIEESSFSIAKLEIVLYEGKEKDYDISVKVTRIIIDNDAISEVRRFCEIELPKNFKDYIIKFGEGLFALESNYKGE